MQYHSIIGDITGKGARGTDGIVPVASAHIEEVESEIIIPAPHTGLHHHPLAVVEVRRILLEHHRQFTAVRAEARGVYNN